MFHAIPIVTRSVSSTTLSSNTRIPSDGSGSRSAIPQRRTRSATAITAKSADGVRREASGTGVRARDALPRFLSPTRVLREGAMADESSPPETRRVSAWRGLVRTGLRLGSQMTRGLNVVVVAHDASCGRSSTTGAARDEESAGEHSRPLAGECALRITRPWLAPTSIAPGFTALEARWTRS